MLMSPSVAHVVALELRRPTRAVQLAGLLSKERGFRRGYEHALRVASSWEQGRDPASAPFATRGPVADAVYQRAGALASEGRED
jgi:hypothetical protein